LAAALGVKLAGRWAELWAAATADWTVQKSAVALAVYLAEMMAVQLGNESVVKRVVLTAHSWAVMMAGKMVETMVALLDRKLVD
jgi:hypothetical protein